MIRLAIFFYLFFLATENIFCQSAAAIFIPKNATEPDRRAAEVLRFYLKKITDSDVQILENEKVASKEQPAVFIGKNPVLKKMGFPGPPIVIPEDGSFLQGKDNRFVILGGGEMGAEYGVYTLLEKLGCRKFSPTDSIIPAIKNLRLPDLPPTLDLPAFPYRELHYQPAFDEAWARWHKLKTQPRKKSEWGMFVHTFDKLCPPEKFFKSNPEFFSWNGSQHSPAQLCLSNDTVRQIVVKTLREKLAEKPDAKYWSVSQNDNYDACRCARCLASDKKFGGQAGTLLAFVNAIAAEFPGKTISTLAYQYTRKAPVGIRPAKNVSVCLCSIECNRGQSIEDGCRDFARDVEEWSKLTDNLMVWDYVVQFRDYLSPFPNWHTLQPNLQFFKKNGVKMLFEQGSGNSRSEFSDMRAYLLAKLMWNPDLNQDSILQEYSKTYYGDAQPYIMNYIKALTENLAATDKNLIIYGTPLTPRNAWLDERRINLYFDYLSRATEAVADPSRDADRLSEAMLPMLHVLFEQNKIRDWAHPCRDSVNPEKWNFCYLPQQWRMVRDFPELCQKFGYETMNENNYPPRKYADDMLDFMKNGRSAHKFMQRPFPGYKTLPVDIQWVAEPSKTYESGDASILLDSRHGSDDYRQNWLGFEGNDFSATFSLPDSAVAVADLPEISRLSVRFLQDQQSWVFFPEKVVLEISGDGKSFKTVKEEKIEIVPDGKKAIRKISANLANAEKIRAIRVRAANQKVCPKWHGCNGKPCWIFVDEVVVD